jgi:hypothetical protein
VAVSGPGAGGAALAFDPASGTGLAVFRGAGDTGRREIFARRIDSRGRPTASPVQTSRTPEGLESDRLDVVFSSESRQYLVVWQEGARLALERGLRGRRIAADGQVVGETFAVGEAPVSAFSPVALAAGRSGFLVGFRSPTGGVGARVLDISGIVQSESVVSTPMSNGCGFPAVAYRARADEYLVGFSCGLPAEAQPPQTQFVRRLDASGGALGSPVPVITPRNTRFGNGEVALAYNARLDQFLFVGQNRRRIGTRRLDGAGAPVGPVRTLRRPSFEFEASSPRVGFDPRAGRYLVAWRGHRRRDYGSAVFSTRVDSRGVERGPEAVRTEVSPSAVQSRGALGGFLLGSSEHRSDRALVRFLAR